MAVKERMGSSDDKKEKVPAACKEFGSLGLLREVTRDVWGWRWLEELIGDAHYGLRMLVKNPGFTVVAVLTLALGIGVSTTLFTAFDSIALRPLPVKDPESVVRFKRWFASGVAGDIQYAFSYPEYLYFRDQNHVFSEVIAASWPTQVVATPPAESVSNSKESREPLPLQCQLVSANYFSALGIGAEVGRAFSVEQNQAPGTNPVIVLSHPFWQHQFNSD